MAQKIYIPNIGDFAQVEVIEVLVKPGDIVDKESSLITLESDKAAMDIPSPQAGKVKELHLKAGDKVGKGDAILSLEPAAAAQADKSAAAQTASAASYASDAPAPQPRSDSTSQAAMPQEQPEQAAKANYDTDTPLVIAQVRSLLPATLPT
ncbi:MAG: biotin/lipoyl-containing protein [Candidatus Porifericomitaceae bacterium WSBS_2022_MAG_OTU9]